MSNLLRLSDPVKFTLPARFLLTLLLNLALLLLQMPRPVSHLLCCLVRLLQLLLQGLVLGSILIQNRFELGVLASESCLFHLLVGLCLLPELLKGLLMLLLGLL